MDTIDVTHHMFPTIIANDRAYRVKSFGQVVECLYVVALGRITGHIRHSPTLIERHPGHDTGMAIIAVKYLQPFACKPLHCSGREDVGIRHLSPDKQAKSITPVEKSWVFDLLVDTY